MGIDKIKLGCQLMEDEGLELSAYPDSLGYLTIGVGRLIDKRKGGGITKTEALFLLNNDIDRHYADLVAALPWVESAPEEVKQVLTNMAFNLGVPGLLKFRTTLGLLEAGQYADAAPAMLDSAWAKQVGKRAQRLSDRIKALA